MRLVKPRHPRLGKAGKVGIRMTMLQDDLRPEYGEDELEALLSSGVHGKYIERYRQGTSLVKLAPDVAAEFSTEQSVNEALQAAKLPLDVTSS